MANSERFRLSTQDGKYTVVQPNTGPAYLLRYGEPWSNKDVNIQYINMIFDLAYEVEELREKIRMSEAQKVWDDQVDRHTNVDGEVDIDSFNAESRDNFAKLGK